MEVQEIHEQVEHAAHAVKHKAAAPAKGKPGAGAPPGRSTPPHAAGSHSGGHGGSHSGGHDEESHGEDRHKEHDGDSHTHGIGVNGRQIAILISVLAALLALVETGAKSSQNEQIAASIEANDLWSFYQGKTVRSAVIQAFSDFADATDAGTLPPDKQEKLVRLLNDWQGKIHRYDSEPNTGEGRKELQARALQAQAKRDLAQNRLHNFEYGAAALQLAVVLASASVVTGAVWLTLSSMALGGVGIGLGLLGIFAPEFLHHHLMGHGAAGGH